MNTMASQITSLMIVYSTIYSGEDQRKHQSFASLAFVWEIHRDRWIPRTKGQYRGICFHLMTSSWNWLWKPWKEALRTTSRLKFLSLQSSYPSDVDALRKCYSFYQRFEYPTVVVLRIIWSSVLKRGLKLGLQDVKLVWRPWQDTLRTTSRLPFLSPHTRRPSLQLNVSLIKRG